MQYLTTAPAPATMDKPFSPASERNRTAILPILQQHLADCRSVLEVGSGTGQHAVFFAAALPQVCWQTSEQAANLPGLKLWLAEAALPNTPPPLTLDVTQTWPEQRFDAVFSANTLHIMSWAAVEQFFSALDRALAPRATLVIYGPFNENGAFTSPSNAAFDADLKARAPHMGLRDLADVDALARGIGLNLQHNYDMPANNRCLVWQR